MKPDAHQERKESTLYFNSAAISAAKEEPATSSAASEVGGQKRLEALVGFGGTSGIDSSCPAPINDFLFILPDRVGLKPNALVSARRENAKNAPLNCRLCTRHSRKERRVQSCHLHHRWNGVASGRFRGGSGGGFVSKAINTPPLRQGRRGAGANLLPRPFSEKNPKVNKQSALRAQQH